VRVSFGTRIEPDLKQQVKTYAAATDQTIEDVVEAALSNHLAVALLTPVDDGQWAVAVAQRQAQALAANYGDVDISPAETDEGGGE
jgi:hypothetical protein